MYADCRLKYFTDIHFFDKVVISSSTITKIQLYFRVIRDHLGTVSNNYSNYGHRHWQSNDRVIVFSKSYQS